MPKIRFDPVSDLEQRLVSTDGHLMTLEGVKRAIGYKSNTSAKSWLKESDVRTYLIQGRTRYDTHDIATEIIRRMI